MNPWTVRLTRAAEQDIEDILDWTFEHFGALQLSTYTDVLQEALGALSGGPSSLDVRRVPELGADVATLHVARMGRKGRHLLVVRVQEQQHLVEVLRVLHDSMDLGRHLPH
jgi:toxin ParE1/3/4